MHIISGSMPHARRLARVGVELSRGARMPRQDLAARAKSLKRSGYSYGKAAEIMGLPKATVSDLVNRE